VKRGKGVLKPGPLFPLMQITLAELTTERIETWLSREAPSRMTQTRLALRLLKAFLNWCSTHEVYKTIIGSDIVTKRITSTLPKKTAKTAACSGSSSRGGSLLFGTLATLSILLTCRPSS